MNYRFVLGVKACGIEQEVKQPYNKNAILSVPRIDIILDNDNLLEVIVDIAERIALLPKLFFIRYCKRRLNIISFISEICHEINLKLLAIPPVIFIFTLYFHYSHIN